jgi:aspartate-semialdehyde dehydrogenase
MHRVPELVTDASTHTDIHPLDRARHQKVETDLSRLLGTSVDNPASAELTEATLQHAPWVRGHYAKIVATLGRDVTKSEVEELWRHFEAPAALGGIRKELKAISRLDKDKWPSRHQKIIPVKLEHGDLLRRHGDRQWLSRIRPMRVAAHVVELDPEEPRTLTFTIAGDNLIQGAVGGNLLNILYARAQGYLG